MSLASRTALGVLAGLTGLFFTSCGHSKASPTSSPTPKPAESSTPSVGSATTTCSLGKGDPNAECLKTSGSGRLQVYVETAIDLVVREKPQLLDLTSEERPNAGTYRILDVESFLDAIVTNVRRQGACSERDPDSLSLSRILVKDSNDLSEGYQLVSDRGFIQRGPDARVQYCDPASFPVDRVGDLPPAGSGCGKPYPPPVSAWAAKVHIYGPSYVTLDSTPLVGPDVVYCANAGFTDGRAWCAVRNDHSQEREACEAWRIGRAKDTGRVGPTWRFRGAYCTGQESGCENHPDRQFGLLAWENGVYAMCDAHGVCGEVEVDR